METKRFSWVQTFSRPMIEQAGFELESSLDGRAERELHRAIEEAGMEATHAMPSRAKWDVWWPPEGELAERELTDKVRPPCSIGLARKLTGDESLEWTHRTYSYSLTARTPKWPVDREESRPCHIWTDESATAIGLGQQPANSQMSSARSAAQGSTFTLWKSVTEFTRRALKYVLNGRRAID